MALYVECAKAYANTCRMERKGTINQFKTAVRPQKFLLQLVSDLTSIFAHFYYYYYYYYSF